MCSKFQQGGPKSGQGPSPGVQGSPIPPQELLGRLLVRMSPRPEQHPQLTSSDNPKHPGTIQIPQGHPKSLRDIPNPPGTITNIPGTSQIPQGQSQTPQGHPQPLRDNSNPPRDNLKSLRLSLSLFMTIPTPQGHPKPLRDIHHPSGTIPNPSRTIPTPGQCHGHPSRTIPNPQDRAMATPQLSPGAG